VRPHGLVSSSSVETREAPRAWWRTKTVQLVSLGSGKKGRGRMVSKGIIGIIAQIVRVGYPVLLASLSLLAPLSLLASLSPLCALCPSSNVLLGFKCACP